MLSYWQWLLLKALKYYHPKYVCCILANQRPLDQDLGSKLLMLDQMTFLFNNFNNIDNVLLNVTFLKYVMNLIYLDANLMFFICSCSYIIWFKNYWYKSEILLLLIMIKINIFLITVCNLLSSERIPKSNWFIGIQKLDCLSIVLIMIIVKLRQFMLVSRRIMNCWSWQFHCSEYLCASNWISILKQCCFKWIHSIWLEQPNDYWSFCKINSLGDISSIVRVENSSILKSRCQNRNK